MVLPNDPHLTLAGFELMGQVADGTVTAIPRQVVYVANGEALSPAAQRLAVLLTSMGLFSDPPGSASQGWTPQLTQAGRDILNAGAPGPRAVMRADGLYCSEHGIVLPMPADGTLRLDKADRAWSAHMTSVHNNGSLAAKIAERNAITRTARENAEAAETSAAGQL